MSDKRLVVISLSVGTASFLGAVCIAVCLCLLALHRPAAKPLVDLPQVPHGDLNTKEANDLKYGPVNLDAAKEVKQGIFSRIRARRAAACAPLYSVPCSPVTYATTPVAPLTAPSSYLPQPSQPVQPSPQPSLPTCPDGDCNQGYMPVAPSTNTPELGSIETDIEAVPPDDSGKMQLLVISRANQTPAVWFESDPNLARVKRAVAFTRIEPGSPMHKERYGYLGTEAPIVALTWPDARTIYFADATNMPVFPDELLREMKSAVTAARNAKPAETDYTSTFLALTSSGSINPDCPDGNCPLPSPPSDGFRFPRLRPNLDNSENPLLDAAEGFLKDSLTSGVWLVFSVVALGFVLVFSILILGAIILVVRSLT